MNRILLVESDITVCSAISRTLAGLGYGIDIAYDAREARELSQQSKYQIGLIGERLSDADGVTLFQELHRSQQTIWLRPRSAFPIHSPGKAATAWSVNLPTAIAAGSSSSKSR